MASEWKEYKLSDLCDSVDYGYTAPANEFPIGPYFLRITDIVSGHIDWKSVPYCKIGQENIPKFRLKHGNIVIARTGATTGVSSYINNPPNAVFASYLVRLKIGEKADSRFISYFLKSNNFWNYMKGVLGDKSAQPNASAHTMTQVKLLLPTIPEQRTIAHILGTFDDKIELNRRMNETLEAMAKAIFKSWFVNFDPVCTKAEGRKSNLPKSISDFFPNSFQDSELGKIPKGWHVKRIRDLAEIVGGSTPSTSNPVFWNNGQHYWASPKDLSSLNSPVLIGTNHKITHSGLAQISSGLLPVGTVLLSSRAPIGYLAITEVPVAINQGFIAMKAKADISNLFLLLWASHAHEKIVSQANGSTFLEISKTNFRPIPVVTPEPQIFKAFDSLIRPVYQQIINNERETRILITVRDAMLPELLSGKIL